MEVMPENDRYLLLRPYVRLLSRPDHSCLDVITRTGHFVFRAGGITRVHDAVGPLIRRGISEKRLLASTTPAHRAIVSDFIQKLMAAYAFDDPHDAPNIAFLSPEEAGGALLELTDNFPRAPRIIIYAPAGELTVYERALISSWLASVFDSYAMSRFRLYHFERRDGLPGLTLDVSLETVREVLELPSRLQIVKFVETDQSPLVVIEARHRLFRQSNLCVGLRYTEVRERTMLSFMGALRGHNCNASGLPDHGAAPRSAEFCAGTITALYLQALEWHAGQVIEHLRIAWKEEPVCPEHSVHDDVRYLCGILSMKESRVVVECAFLDTGLILYKWREFVVGSFIRTKALRDILLIAVAATYYSTEPRVTEAACRQCWDYSAFASRVVLRQIIRRYKAHCADRSQQIKLNYEGVRCWGRRLFCGSVVVP